MDSRIIFIKTGKGDEEVRSKAPLLSGDLKRALLMVDGTATFGEISKRAAPSLRNVLDEILQELEKGGFIQDRAKVTSVPRMVVPPKMAAPLKKPADEGVSELDFTAAFRAPSPEALVAEAVKVKAKEAAKLKAQQEVEAARIKAEQEAARSKAEAEAKARAEAETKAREEAERRAQEQAEAARIKAEQEAARSKAEAEAKARAEAETKAREEAEQRAQEQAEAARIKAEQEAARSKAEAEAKARAEAETKAREEAERRAQEQAEAARIKAEQEAARSKAEAEAKARAEAETKAREEAERRAQEQAEAARIKAEQEAARSKAEAEAKARAEAETKAREEAERRAQEQAEATRIKAEQEAARSKAEAEAKARTEAETKAREEAEQHDAKVIKAKQSAQTPARFTSATVLFFDVIGYTKQSVNKQIKIKKQFNQLLSDCLGSSGGDDRIILDTGDGAAVGFLQHPEDALVVAMLFRKTVMTNEHKDYTDLKVRIGIHLGPVNIIQDVNGQNNMVGDGINDAQRVMSFAGTDQVYISRSYYDFVSRLSDEYANLFQYRGAQQDKHGREHPVYELVDASTVEAEVVVPKNDEATVAINLEPFNFAISGVAAASVPETDEEPETQQDVAAQLLSDAGQLNLPEQKDKPEEVEPAAPQQSVSQGDIVGESPKAETKPVAQAYMPSEEEVRKLAEAQAKTWAGAEQRAAEAASASVERAAQPREVPHSAKDTQVVRARRKPLPWGKVGAGLFVLLLSAAFAVPYLIPMQDYAARIEQSLTTGLQQPVHIGQLAGRLLPTPRLELSNISIGEAKQLQVQRAQVNFALSALFSSNKPINAIELEGMQISNADLTQISAWLTKIAADTRYPVALIKLSQGRLEAEGVQLSGIDGEIGFTQAGRFARAKLNTGGNKLALDISVTPENKMRASIVAHGALPLLPDWIFDELNASGELNNDELVISDLDGRIMGGRLIGNARIGWRSGWDAQVTLTVKDITLQNINKVLNGDMDGTAHIRAQATNLPKLVEIAALDGTFVIRKGTINGMDIVETTRLRSRENLPGGRTYFDELNGSLSASGGVYAFRQLKMNAGVLTATGSLDITKQKLSGRILADLSMRAGMGSVALQIGGTTGNPTLRAVP